MPALIAGHRPVSIESVVEQVENFARRVQDKLTIVLTASGSYYVIMATEYGLSILQVEGDTFARLIGMPHNWYECVKMSEPIIGRCWTFTLVDNWGVEWPISTSALVATVTV